MPSPIEQYHNDQQQLGFSADIAQANAIEHLQRLYEDLCADERLKLSPTQWSQRLSGWMGGKSKQQATIKGLYFWGGVGRGKTYLMDVFYQCLPFENKQRTHFHRFMRYVHGRLAVHTGAKNPLQLVAQELAKESRIICFDEFFVTDITDAMILAQLLDSLFGLGVVLVATSNIEPKGLYENGLQRQRFLPAIALLEGYTEVINVDGGVDYRLRTLSQAELYHWPLDEAADVSLASSFAALVPMLMPVLAEPRSTDSGNENGIVNINGRDFTFIRQSDGIIWFTFDQLCVKPRSQNDYLELACEFHGLIISNVPCLRVGMEDQARRFVNLVDVCYDASLKVIISAEVPLLELYSGGQLDFVFRRTLSRLQEMQSYEYLARGHVAG
ncbi:MAG: cell division protein ZapE [Pseudomonadales bacterium]|nr:cell division protein ZapE [Pseudomonadales bacterium]